MKLTEDETIDILMRHLKTNGWNIDSHCLGQTHGCDIIASNDKTQLIIEVKGAKAGDKSPTKKREYFDSGQIKTHFGKAIVKALEQKHLNPKSKIAIAHPNDDDIKRSIGQLTPYLKTIGVKHYWVSADGNVTED
ncbi:MAG: hypothetical protein M0D57_16020 [Sphingobacteriales bacterium JAD_PAG50586_3]|nr:MAG: hypothetical protein M0D57_16020 [Sphingobacteriales bacterium JAD_PAG50586_3]